MSWTYSEAQRYIAQYGPCSAAWLVGLYELHIVILFATYWVSRVLYCPTLGLRHRKLLIQQLFCKTVVLIIVLLDQRGISEC